MTERVALPLEAIVPTLQDVIRAQGIPAGAEVRDRVWALGQASLRAFAAEARPVCIAADVSRSDFVDIFQGDGRNDDEAPLGAIYPRADRLVLFALTMGHDVSRTIQGYIDNSDFALGAMLDSVASLAVENSIGLLEKRTAATPAADRAAGGNCSTLNYSPGYCGWHIGAQAGIFGYLDPGQLGITLNDSYLMTPLKSATGVLVHGDRAIHEFDIGFRFCRACRDKTCLGRRDGLGSVSSPPT